MSKLEFNVSQQLDRTETVPQFKVSSKRPENRGVDLPIPGLVVQHVIHYTTAASECETEPGCVAQSVGHLTRVSEVLGSIPGLATYFRFSLRCFKRGSCQLLAKVCARSTG